MVHAMAEALPKSTISKLVLYKLTPTTKAEFSGPLEVPKKIFGILKEPNPLIVAKTVAIKITGFNIGIVR